MEEADDDDQAEEWVAGEESEDKEHNEDADVGGNDVPEAPASEEAFSQDAFHPGTGGIAEAHREKDQRPADLEQHRERATLYIVCTRHCLTLH